MRAVVAGVNRLMTGIVVAALGFMFALLFTNVVLRFGFSSGLSFAEELARYAFLWCTFLGAVLALGQNAHIGIAGIRPRVPERFSWLFDAVVVAIQLVVSAIVLVGSVEILLANMGGRAPVSGAPVSIAFAALVTGAAAILVVFGGRLWRAIAARRER